MQFWLRMGLHLIAVVVSFLSVRWTLPMVLQMLTRSGLVRPNFRGQETPVAGGLVLIIVPLFWLAAGAAAGLYEQWQALALVMLLLAFGLLGFIDDALGTREKTGFKGHISALMRGELTTGGFKAVSGGLVALAFAAFAGGLSGRLTIWNLVLNTLVVALSANAMNLFDLRPGRAGKAFLVVALVLIAVCWPPENAAIMLPLLAALAGFLPADLSARTMMGDTGSNPLGAALGAFAVFSLSPFARLIYLAALIFLHVLAEFASLSTLIERSRLLRAIDHWGRSS